MRLRSPDLHPATGGSGLELCSGDMLLEALVACAGVTLKAVATALDIPLKSGAVSAEGDLDFRGTLGVAKDAPVGFAQIRLRFDLDTDAPQDKLDQLLKLTERYCVVYQTIKNGPPVDIRTQSRVTSAELFWYGLALKMVLTATVVVVTSLAVERSGPFVGALIGAAPTAAGAAYTILALEHSPDFIAASAVGSVAVNAAVAIFAAAYAAVAQRHGLFVSLGVASAVWFAAAAALRTSRLDAAQRRNPQRRGFRHHHSTDLALPRRRSAGEIPADAL